MPAPVSLRLHDAPKYEEFYGFVHPPFTVAPDPRLVYTSRSQDRALTELLRAVRAREAVVLVTGDDGTGKTTICRALAERLEGTILTSLVVGPIDSVEDLLRRVLQDAGVISRDGLRDGRVTAATRQELAAALDDLVRSLPATAGSCVLIIDEAHRLPGDVLQHLGAMKTLQIVLAAEPALLETLNRSPDASSDDDALRELDERIVTRVRIEGLSADDVGGYIAQRLVAAGGAGAPTFEPTALQAVHRHTGGVPRTIDALCDRALTLGAQLGVSVIGPEIVDEAARGLGLAPSTGASSGWWAALPRWARVAIPIVVLLALIAVWFSIAPSGLFP